VVTLLVVLRDGTVLGLVVGHKYHKQIGPFLNNSIRLELVLIRPERRRSYEHLTCKMRFPVGGQV